MTTSVEFYRELSRHIPHEAAKMIAEELVPASQAATKADLDNLHVLMKSDLAATENRLLRDIHGLHRWMLTFFAAQWLSTIGIIVTILLKH